MRVLRTAYLKPDHELPGWWERHNLGLRDGAIVECSCGRILVQDTGYDLDEGPSLFVFLQGPDMFTGPVPEDRHAEDHS